MIDIENLTIEFGTVRPINALTLRIESPRHGIIGPNGAGKTTLLNAMSGFVRPLEGTISAFDADIGAMSPRARARWGLRRTFQTEQLAEDLSAWDNIAIARDHCGGAGRTVGEACELVGLTAPRRPARSLPTIDRRLTELARAVVGAPRIILMDEPAAGVAGADRDRFTSLLAAIPEHTGAWLMIIDHDIELIAAVCDTTTALDFGSIVASGPTADTLADPSVAEVYLGTTLELG